MDNIMDKPFNPNITNKNRDNNGFQWWMTVDEAILSWLVDKAWDFEKNRDIPTTTAKNDGLMMGD